MIYKLKILLKNNPYLFDLYYYCFSYLLRIIGLFVPLKDRILFVSFGGKKFDDSPKAIYDEIINNQEFSEYELCWAFDNVNQFDIPKGRKICINSFSYLLYALSSKIWITNSSIEKGMKFKKKHTYYVNTWHGIPLKKIGSDELGKNEKHGLGSKESSTANLVTSQSAYDQAIFTRLFKVDIHNVIVSGLPRNDILVNHDKKDIEAYKKKIGIPLDKKVILYAPTYREFTYTLKDGVVQQMPLRMKELKEKLSDNYILLFRAHYEVAKVLDITFDDFIIDVSNYPTLSDLMISADILLTDYSSMIFDFSILEKPIVLYCYDLEEYMSKRGMYFDIRDLKLPLTVHQDELYELIQKEDTQSVSKLKEKYCIDNGTASKQVIKLIKNARGKV